VTLSGLWNELHPLSDYWLEEASSAFLNDNMIKSGNVMSHDDIVKVLKDSCKRHGPLAAFYQVGIIDFLAVNLNQQFLKCSFSPLAIVLHDCTCVPTPAAGACFKLTTKNCQKLNFKLTCQPLLQRRCITSIPPMSSKPFYVFLRKD
jgi:hypothetical protein